MPPDHRQLRAAAPGDLPAVRQITAEGYPGVSLFEPNELEWALEHAAGFWVATSGGRNDGYVITFEPDARYDAEVFQWFARNMKAFLYIDRVAVAAHARHSGVGQQLYAQVEQFARAHGLSQLVCEVNVEPPNPDSLAFHARLGFERLGVLDTRDGHRVALLSKRLER